MTRPLFFTLLIYGQFSFAQKTIDNDFGKPVLWYTVYNPWVMFMGSEGPIFILYETGKVIYWRDKAYHFAEMPKSDVKEIITELNFNDTFFIKSKYVQATYSTDQPSYVLKTNLDTVKYFTIYGSMNSKEDRNNIPRQLRDIYNFVTNFEEENAINWLPDKIEIMLTDYSNSQDMSIQWPKDWPDLNSPETIKRKGGTTSIFLDKKYFGKLIALLKKRKEKQAIEISGKKFYAEYRFPIPNLY